MAEETRQRKIAAEAAAHTAIRMRALNTMLYGLEKSMQILNVTSQNTASSLASMTGRAGVSITTPGKLGGMMTSDPGQFAATARAGAGALGPQGSAMAEELISTQNSMQGLDSDIVSLADGTKNAKQVTDIMNERFKHLPPQIRKALVEKIKDMVIDVRSGKKGAVDVQKLMQQEEAANKRQIDIINTANEKISKGLNGFIKEIDKMHKGAAILTKTELDIIATQQRQQDYMAKLEGGGPTIGGANQGAVARVNAQLRGTRMAGAATGGENINDAMALFGQLNEGMIDARDAIQREKDLREDLKMLINSKKDIIGFLEKKP